MNKIEAIFQKIMGSRLDEPSQFSHSNSQRTPSSLNKKKHMPRTVKVKLENQRKKIPVAAFRLTSDFSKA